MTMKRILFLFSMVTVTLAISIPGIPGRSAVSGYDIPKVGGGQDLKGAADKLMNIAAKRSGIPDIGGGFDVKGAADKFMNIAGKGSGASNIGGGLDFKGAANKLIELKRHKDGEGRGIYDLVRNTHSEGENPKEKLQNAMKYSKDAMKVINTMKSYKGKSDIKIKKNQSSKDHSEEQHKNTKSGESVNGPY